MDQSTGRAGIIRAPDDASQMDKLSHAVLDDVLYNILCDILIKTHRDEKTARAKTAAIRVEKLASDASESSTPDSRPDVRVETEAAIYEDGRVLLKGNPLETTRDILCPKCHLPRLLYPTDGKGARPPDPNVVNCKKHPYIEKPGCDIYGQTWVAPGPGRGKKKKDVEKKDVSGSPAPEQRPPNVLSFPSATCSKCKRCILVTRLNNHMGSCIGNSGRNASRAAAQKINNGGSQHESTPPSSQKATPVPGPRASSPRKRDASDDEDESDTSHRKKKKLKTAAAAATTTTSLAMGKKVILKSKPNLKRDKIKGASLLSREQKAGDSEAERAPSDSPTPRQKGTATATATAASSGKDKSPLKKVKLARAATSSPVSKNGRDADADSESSGILSSPPIAPRR